MLCARLEACSGSSADFVPLDQSTVSCHVKPGLWIAWNQPSEDDILRRQAHHCLSSVYGLQSKTHFVKQYARQELLALGLLRLGQTCRGLPHADREALQTLSGVADLISSSSSS